MGHDLWRFTLQILFGIKHVCNGCLWFPQKHNLEPAGMQFRVFLQDGKEWNFFSLYKDNEEIILGKPM